MTAMVSMLVIVQNQGPQVISTATVVAVIAGAVGGIVTSLVEGWVAQRLEYLGRVSIWPREWSIVFVDESGKPVDSSASQEVVAAAHYAVNVRFFNRKRVGSGFRDVRITFTVGSQCDPVSHVPYDPDKPASDESTRGVSVEFERVDLINLPSREYVLQRLRGKLGPSDARKVRNCEKVEFVGVPPSDRERRTQLDPSN